MDFWLLPIFGVGLFCWLLPFGSSRQAIGHGFLMGFSFFAVLLFWIAVFTYHAIGALGIVAWLLSAGIQSAFIAGFAVGANAVWARLGWIGRVLVIPSVWVIFEWLRQLGTFGMGWGDLAYTQWEGVIPQLIAPITGIWGITWIVAAIGCGLFAFAQSGRYPKLYLLLIAPIVVAFGIHNSPGANLCCTPGRGPIAASIQANINQDVPWSFRWPADAAYYQSNLDTFGQMIRQAETKDHASLCVLAETAIPGYPQFDPQLRAAVTSWAVDNHVTIVSGGRYVDMHSRKDQNVVFEISPTGHWSAPYAKTRLVPFGEYVPYRRFFPFLEALHVAVFDMKAGASDQPPLSASGSDWRVGPMVCYESAFAGYARQQVLGGATVLSVVTDDTWFGRTAAARQHEAMSALRAAETHRPLVRCGATGISAIFDENGKDVSELGIFRKGIVAAAIKPQTDITPYVRYGDWFVGLCAGIVVLVVGWSYLPTRTHLPASGCPFLLKRENKGVSA